MIEREKQYKRHKETENEHGFVVLRRRIGAIIASFLDDSCFFRPTCVYIIEVSYIENNLNHCLTKTTVGK